MFLSWYIIKKKILVNYQRYLKTQLYLYYTRGARYQYEKVFPIDIATSLHQLSSFVCDKDFMIIAKHRFSLGQTLFYCYDNNVIVGYGWKVSRINQFYAWEIGNNIHFHQPVDVLYDFYVYPDYRRRGIYKSILRFIANTSIENVLMVIYAETANDPSNTAIRECGFHLVKTINFVSSHRIISLFP